MIGMIDNRASRREQGGFTLIELLVVISVLALLAMMLVPGLAAARAAARRAVCAVNLRNMQTALVAYLTDNEGKFFPYRENVPEGVLWYWGLEASGGSGEGGRPLDRSRARLASYFEHAGKTETCPSFPYDKPYFKRKFATISYGYGINRQMLLGMNGGTTIADIARPAATVAWAESIQINTWQAPASPANPMLEEWYYLDNRIGAPATFHFRHRERCNAAFADGGVRPLSPYWLDQRCDGLVGRPQEPVKPSEVSELLRLDK